MKKTKLEITTEEAQAIFYAIDCAIGELVQLEDDEIENLGLSTFQDLLLDLEHRLGRGQND